MTTMTFEQVVEMVKQFSTEQQGMLTDLMHGWQIEALRHEIAKDARESLTAFRSGQFKPQSAKAVIKELRKYVENQE